MQSLKQIEEQQKELQAAIQTAKAEKEEMLERDRDFYDPKAKDLPPPKMEELRDNNTIQMDEDDMARRKDDAHKARKKFIPSGGLAGFRQSYLHFPRRHIPVEESAADETSGNSPSDTISPEDNRKAVRV
ncbi:MAG: hypothetical protein FRX49_06929 [Trebouxia sp. A1-2]|nr:MAG: hypothetical protein FRX49_06929 [Trebouxia sp. A1-2]